MWNFTRCARKNVGRDARQNVAKNVRQNALGTFNFGHVLFSGRLRLFGAN